VREVAYVAKPDPTSLPAAVQPEPPDCIADVPARLKDEVAVRHGNAEPPDARVDPEQLR
jgi:hypothetical protein